MAPPPAPADPVLANLRQPSVDEEVTHTRSQGVKYKLLDTAFPRLGGGWAWVEGKNSSYGWLLAQIDEGQYEGYAVATMPQCRKLSPELEVVTSVDQRPLITAKRFAVKPPRFSPVPIPGSPSPDGAGRWAARGPTGCPGRHTRRWLGAPRTAPVAPRNYTAQFDRKKSLTGMRKN